VIFSTRHDFFFFKATTNNKNLVEETQLIWKSSRSLDYLPSSMARTNSWGVQGEDHLATQQGRWGWTVANQPPSW